MSLIFNMQRLQLKADTFDSSDNIAMFLDSALFFLCTATNNLTFIASHLLIGDLLLVKSLQFVLQAQHERYFDIVSVEGQQSRLAC